MIRISALADEISPDLDTQMAVLREEGIHHLELRGAWDTNVLDLSDAQVAEIGRALAAAGLRVSAIASPIGKVAIDSPEDAELPRLARAIAVAQALGTDRIRIFSFYPAAGDESPPAREAVLSRLRALTAQARAAGVTLLHENEKDIYGDSIERCVDLLQSVDDPHFRALLDPAIFCSAGSAPYPDGLCRLTALARLCACQRRGPGRHAGGGGGRGRRLAGLAGALARRRLRRLPVPGAASGGGGQFQGFSGVARFRRRPRPCNVCSGRWAGSMPEPGIYKVRRP